MKRSDDIVSASEIASWAWCPESWRLASLGAEPMNRVDMERGERHHATKAIYEDYSRSAISLGWWLVVAAVILAALALAFVLARGR